MRINRDNNSMDIEPRDLNFIIDNYLINYMFHNKNKPPKRVTIPMYPVAKTRYGNIPIEFVPDISEIAVDIIEDGKDIEEITPSAADELANVDAEIEEIKRPLRDRLPRKHTGPEIPPGLGGIDLPQPSPRNLRQLKADLASEKEVNEADEVEVNVEKSEDGNKRVS